MLSISSCEVIEELRYSISGDIIDPVDGFSRDKKNNALIYKENKYFLVQEINGDCKIDITEDDILLGRTSNFPFFPDHVYHISSEENPSFIVGSSASFIEGTYVFLREDIYSKSIVYALNGSSYEFEFTSAFVKTNKVDYGLHIESFRYTEKAKVDFYMKETPIIRASKQIYLIEDTWYCVESDVAYQLSDEFVLKLREEGTIN